MKRLIFIITFFLYSGILFAQTEKRPLTHDDILKWNRITETYLSNNGEFVVYKLDPWKGDPILKITTSKGEELASFTGGTNASITADSKFVVFTKKALVDSVRALKLKKAKKEDLPKDQLFIWSVANQNIDTILNIKSVKVPKEWAGWIAWQTEAPQDTTKKKGEKPQKKGPGSGGPGGPGAPGAGPGGPDNALPLFIQNTETASVVEIPNVNSYLFSEEEKIMVFVSEGKENEFEPGVYVYNLEKDNKVRISPEGKVKKITANKQGNQVAYLADTVKAKKAKSAYSLYLWNGSGEANIVANNSSESIPEDWQISENGSLSFSDNGERLFFGTAPKPLEKDTTVLEDEIPVLDIWHWKDEVLQPAQVVSKKRDSQKTYMSVFLIDENKTVQLETKLYSGLRTIKNGDADKLFAWSNHPYAVQAMWEGDPNHNDFYLVDIKTGKAEMIKKDCRANPSVSPEGKYLYWYNAMDTSWNTFNIATGKEFKITTPDVIQTANELNDLPNPPDSYRNGGWLKNDEAFLVYDRFDIWKVDPVNAVAPVNLTQNGRLEQLQYRIVNFDAGQGRPFPGGGGGSQEGIDPAKPLFLTAHNEDSRADSYFRLDLKKHKEPRILLSGNYKLGTPRKAKDEDVFVFTKEDFQTYPDLIATDLNFQKQIKISDAAPQQDEFIWGTAELVSWQSLDGKTLEGTLHKPENFDPTKKYPMIVNFYEKSSQQLLSYHMPELHRSTIDYHYYTSNGYVVFNPDIYYTDGYPGESAFNCIMPGINAVVAMGFVDEAKIGAQGHSWGGYQVAYLATRTDMFAAIESGAPVVNMFSAYGGIRWGSGLNRAFQYEHGQSRIGKSIWESPLRYLENSPLFTLDKVETPILIMHNDNDGSVPWYQGIEFFVGLRRLGKPAWMLNYNEADHWPTKIRDKEDFQIRLAQFFDHYLKGKPMPKWMKEGIPAVNKGLDLGYELVE